MFLNPTNPTQTTAELLKAIVATIIQGTELETHYDFLKNTFAIYTPFITQDSWGRLPGALLCILQDKKDCGIIASFVRRFSGQIGGSLQDMSDALKRQACSTTSANMNSFGRSAVTSLGTFLSPSARTSSQAVAARIPDLQVQVASFLDLLPQVIAQRLQVAWQVFLSVVFPAFERYIGDKLIKLILTPADFIMSELQMLVGVPSLDQNEQCSQGDLKQLIIWGMSHNMSWSFDETILDMYLSSPLCIYPTPECRNIHFSRSLMPDTSTVFEGCDQYNFTAFNETLCTKLPQNRLNSTVLRSVCSAMDSLTASQVSRVASNGCARANQVSSFFQAQLESYASPCEPRSKVTRSVSESQLSLSDLVCLYDIWTNSDSVDPASVALCSENDQESFILAVCYNGKLLDILIKDNDWLFAYCSNFSDAFTIVSVYNWCTYSSWVSDQIDVTLVAFCWNNDRAQFEKLLCEDLGLFLQIMSNPENNWIVANCTPAVEPIDIAIVDNVDQWCSVFSSVRFCQYGQWAETAVDPSIVALCWDQDQHSFSKNVCCNMDLLEKITQDPQNEWLLSVCRGNSSETANETKEVLELVCRYSEWTDPAGIDMTDIAVCSEFDTVSSALRKAANNIVALLVTLEESKLVSLQVTENIRLSVLKSVMDYLKHEESFTNKRELLQCFGNLLMNLMQTGREVSDGNFFLIKEYFQLPIKDLKPILMPVEIKAGRQILQYLNRNWAALKLSDRYLQTMASVFFQKYMSIDSTIFLEFGQLLPYFSVLEISSLPGLQNNKAALVSINQIFHKLTLDQRREFGKWFGSSTQFLNVTQWPMSAIQDAGSLLAYLPFEKFKTLSAAQMFFGLDILLNNPLTGLQRCFIAQSILKTYHNLTAPDFRRLGNLTCLANTADLLVYKQTPALDAIKQNIQDCVRLGSVVPSEMVSSLLVERAVLAEPGSLSPEQLYHLAVIMPSLGIPFINQLLPSQVQAALPALSSVDFSPAQQVLPEMLASLGTLISGVKAETLRVLPTDTLITALPNITLQRSRLSPAQHTAITTKLWGSDQVTGWLGALDPLLPETPLLSVRSRLTRLLSNLSTVSHRAWNTQQAKLLFRESLKAFSDIREDEFLSLGMISQGVDCETLKRRFLSSSPSVISRILLFLHGLPAQLHSSLKKCITNESYNFSFSAGLLEEMGAQVSVELPVSIIKRFPADMMETFRRIIVNAPEYFLRLPSIKQSLLVNKVVQKLV
ncbi:stereocilin-like [Acipenser oxyrinchus oxyrinchus]|uniref:Stereocilin-like n=1 Tax=Acipenser oxyrinchus oxyrinchus TaxID=40147 RepID=A0AAD8CVU0_ACIOX|nr:stereocilin-like [Acipenser oxyrinchus oxyrinchus]